MTIPRRALPLRTRLAPVTVRLTRSRAADAAAIGLLLVAAVLVAAPLLQAGDLATAAGDWYAHAYRIRDLRQYGLTSWTHDWAGGLPLWSAYQFVPHLLTWAGMSITGAEETRAMAVGQGILLIWLPLSMFLALRLFGLRPTAALAGALLLLLLDSRRQAVANFSELWGLALSPALLWAAYFTAGRRSGYGVAAVCGAAVYVHPLAAVTGGLGMITASLVHGTGRGGRCRHGRGRVGSWALSLAIQCGLALGASAFFWLSAFVSARPAYEHPYFSSPGFEQLLARLTTGSFAPGWPVWLALAAMCGAVVAARSEGDQRHHARYLLTIAALILALALTSMAGWGPRAYLNAQLPRLLSTLPILAAALLALTLDAALGWRPAHRRGHRGSRRNRLLGRLAPTAIVLGSLVALAGWRAWSASGLSTAASAPASSFTRWLLAQPPGVTAVGGRVFAVPELVPDASYHAYGRVWFTGSYSGREWSILGPPLRMLMEGEGAAQTRAAYLTALAVDLAVVPAGHRPAISDPRSGAPATWVEVAKLDGIDVLRLPWRAPYAFLAPLDGVAALQAPDLAYRSVEESYIRDELTRRYAALAVGTTATPARVSASSPTTVDLVVPSAKPNTLLLVNENWDTAGRASASGRSLPVFRAGPNLLAVDLLGVPADLDGTITVRLTHTTPWTWWAGGVVALLTLPAMGAAMRWAPAPATRRRRSSADGIGAVE